MKGMKKPTKQRKPLVDNKMNDGRLSRDRSNPTTSPFPIAFHVDVCSWLMDSMLSKRLDPIRLAPNWLILVTDRVRGNTTKLRLLYIISSLGVTAFTFFLSSALLVRWRNEALTGLFEMFGFEVDSLLHSLLLDSSMMLSTSEYGGGALFWLPPGDSSFNVSMDWVHWAALASLMRIKRGLAGGCSVSTISSSSLSSWIGLKNEPKMAQFKVIPAKTSKQPLHPCRAITYWMMGGSTNVPTPKNKYWMTVDNFQNIPDPQTAMPVANARCFSK